MSEVETIPTEVTLPKALSEQLPKEVWVARLITPDNRGLLVQALGSFPPGVLVKLYWKQFKPQDKQSYLIIRKPGLKQATDESVIEHLDRLQERRPEVVTALVNAWLDHYQSLLLALGTGEEMHGEANIQVLEVGCWLWESDEKSPQPTWGMIRTLLRLPLLLTPKDHSEVTSNLEAATVELEDLRKRINKMEKEKTKLQRNWEELGQKYNALRKEKDALAVKLERETQARQRVEVREKEVVVQTSKVQQELEKQSKSFERLRGDLFEHAQEILRLRQNNQDGANRLLQAHQEIESLRGECKKLQESNRRLERQMASQVPLPRELIDAAFIVDYPNLGSSPVERLVGLFELYQASLEVQSHPLLHLHTNWNDLQDQKPAGILLLGLEQMLLDGVNIPLSRFLRMSVFNTEALLYSLTHRLTSPRLEQL